MEEEILDVVLEALRELLPGERLSAETRLLEEGLLDSMLVTALALDLAERLELELGPAQLTQKNFATPASIARMAAELREW